MKVYISGPITGLEFEVFMKNFKDAEDYLLSKGFEVVNPCTIDHSHSKTWEDYMLCDIKALFPCDAIYMIDGWRNSRGARIERAIAAVMDKTVMYATEIYERRVLDAKP
jgi:hypothetical protein